MIPQLDLTQLEAGDSTALQALEHALTEVGFLTLDGTGLSRDRVAQVLETYRAFFELPDSAKADVDMARTGSNRGWGAGGAERVDPTANPDYKEVFDCGYELPVDHPLAPQALSVYARNHWPDVPVGFQTAISDYYRDACGVSLRLLRVIARVLGEPQDHFAQAFTHPMALLRGNFYPRRPDWAGALDFGIAPHTDYGCLTLLAMDGQPGLDVQRASGTWESVQVPVGTFVINFGEMLEIWSGGRVRATPHRVIGTDDERLSIPLFFNPAYDTDVAPRDAASPILAGPYLSRRYNETYLHLAEPA